MSYDKMKSELDEMHEWAIRHKDAIIQLCESGDKDASVFVAVHRMYVRAADIPTLGILMACYDELKRAHKELD